MTDYANGSEVTIKVVAEDAHIRYAGESDFGSHQSLGDRCVSCRPPLSHSHAYASAPRRVSGET